MAIWVEAPDPASQADSREIPFSNGIIGDRTLIRIPTTLYRNLMKASPEAQAVFDLIAMRMSHKFPGWKGTRCDFRFGNYEETRVFVLTPMKKFIRVEIRTDATGYRNHDNMFPLKPAASSVYPGSWIRANVNKIAEANAIADDIESVLR